TGEGWLFGSQKWAGEFAFDLGASAVDTVRSLWLKKAGKEPEGMKAYRQMGGGGDAGLYTGTGLRKTINQKVMPTQSLAARQRAARIIKAPTEAIEAFNNTLETMNRYAEFQRSKRQGKSDLEAFNNSLEITLNFRRKGSWAKLLDPIIPFYNAMMQDIYKTARVVRNADTVAGRRQLGRLLTRVLPSQAMIGVLEVLLHSDDDEYKDLPRDMKDKYWILWRNPSGTFVKIPKPASIFPRFFSGMGRRATDYIRGDKQAFRGFGESMASEVWPTTIFDPLIAIASNRTWYGGIIENYSDKEVQSVYRYDENTSEIAKWIGKVTGRWGSADGSGFTDGMSPKEIQYVIDQYTGILGDMILPFTTKNTTGSAVTKMVANRFVVDPVLTNRHMNEFYDFAGEIEQIKETIERHGTYDGLKSVPAVALHGAESLHSGAIKRGEALIKEYRKAVDAMDKQGLSPEERTKQGRALRDALNEKLKEINKELIAYLRKVK
ncbi:MAG: LPD38 domain-containing protein, partial [Anaerovoracaceae bacterium]